MSNSCGLASRAAKGTIAALRLSDGMPGEDAASPENALTLGARNYTLGHSLTSLLKNALPWVRIKSPG